MGPLPRSRVVRSIRDERLLGCGRVKTRQRLVERTSRLVKRSSSARHPSVGFLYLGTPDADHKVEPFGPRQGALLGGKSPYRTLFGPFSSPLGPCLVPGCSENGLTRDFARYRRTYSRFFASLWARRS